MAVWTTKPTEIGESHFLTGEIPRGNSFEDTGGRFFLDEACRKPDPLVDDQALFFDTPEGIVVLLGCAHAGSTELVQRFVNWNERSKGVAVVKFICGILVILGGVWLINIAP